MFAKAGKALGVDAATVSNSVHALCHVFVSAATAGRAAADVLHGLDDVPLPAESRQALIDFYSDVAPELGVPSPPLATPASLDCGHRTPNPLPCLPLQARESCIAIAAGVAGWG